MQRKPMHLSLTPSVARTAGLIAALALVSTSAQAKLSKRQEAWYNFKFKGAKVGFLYAKDEPTKVDGRAAIHIHRRSVISVRRQAQSIRMESITDAWVAPDGTPMRFTHKRIEGGDTRSVEGYRDGNELVVEQNVGGNVRKSKIALTQGGKRVLFASSLELLFAEGLRVGKTMTGLALDEAEAQVQPFEMKVVKAQGPDLLVAESLGPVHSEVLMSKKGHVKKTTILGIGAQFEETNREDAVRFGEQVDIFSQAMFSVPKPLPRNGELDRLVVRVRGLSGKRPRYLAGPRQKAKKVGKDSVELTIQISPTPKWTSTLPVRGKKEFLKETPYEPLKDERLVLAAQRATKGSKTVWDAARKINTFVYQHIKKKTLARAFATATEAFESQEGDCTEHAVLFSALAKISGIPTRLATGLVYVGGAKNVFGYHEWVEVWTGKTWFAMDPTFGQDIADPTHIKFAHGQADAEGLREAGMVAAALIGDMELSVLSYKTVDGVQGRP